MNKRITLIIFLIVFLLGFSAFPLFSIDITDGGSDISAEKMLEVEELEDSFDDKSSGKKDVLRERGNILSGKGMVQRNIYWYEYVQKAFAYCIDKFGEAVVTAHNTLFGLSRDGGVSLRDRLRGYYSGNVFSWFLTVFIVAQCFIYAIRVVRDTNFQYSDLVGFGIKIVIVLLFFYFLPFLPKNIINLAFSIAEKIAGVDTGELGFYTPMACLSSIGSFSGRTGINTLIASFVEASLGVEVGVTAELTVSGHALYVVSFIIVICCFAGVLVAFINSLRLFFRAILFFITNIALVAVLPSVVFTGFGESKTTVGGIAKYYFFNMVELLISGVIVLIGTRAMENIGPPEDKPIPLCLGLLVGLPVLQCFLLRETHRIVKTLKGEDHPFSNIRIVNSANRLETASNG